MAAIQKGQQPADDRAETRRRGGSFGNVTRAAALGMPLSGSANNNIGNQTMDKGGTRPIATGTKTRGGSFSTVVNKKAKGMQ